MDQFFTSLNKRQTMLLLTAITFGGQEGVASLEHLAPEEGELLHHRAQEIMQIPREKRIPLLVQEIKKLVKDRRGQLWSAEPEKLAALIQKERGALAEVVLRALPSVLAEAVRTLLPQRPVKLAREVRPQVLDIIRWKLEERLKRSSGAQATFKFTDVLMLQPRELLTVCDRLGARVLGPALAGLPDAQRDGLIAALPPDIKALASKAVQANAPRKLPEEEAKEQLAVHDGLKNLAGAIRSAGTQRLARACVSQSAEFAARMLERHRGDFGSLLAKWVRDERSKPTSRMTDGGRADIVADLERLAARGLIERPVRLTPQRPVLNPPPMRGGAPPNRDVAPARMPGGPERSNVLAPPPPRRDAMAEREARRAGAAAGASSVAENSVRRDPMAERAARRAGALSSREPSRIGPPIDDDPPELSRKQRVPREASVNMNPRRDSQGVPPDPGGARIGPPPAREASRVGSRQPPPESEGSRASSRQPPPELGDISRPASRRPPPEVVGADTVPPRRDRGAVPPARVPPRVADRSPAPLDPDGSRVISSPGIRGRVPGVRGGHTEEPERPPRVLSGKTAARPSLSSRGEGAGGQRTSRPPSGGNSGRGPRGGSR
ncbi:hypothetical protein [Hyalangium sp.]|uniref:hypothetical protein n=1 Tax=Hyalangium sp. TaxID=2028555 RepID=UPI002D2311D9|nr:hypothetical protein [Hyalangium sp.]HYH95824.1 hypothetical protein [Hyalangium sp.]